MSTERVYTLTSSQLAATAEMISCLNAGLPLPDLIKEAVPRDVQGILTQQFSLLRTVSAADIGKEAKGGKQAKEGKEKKRKQDTEKVMRGMTSYNLFAQRVQTIADLHKEHPIIQQVNPDGTKKMMAWIGEVWALTSDAHKERFNAETKELLKVINAFREQYPTGRSPEGINLQGLVAAYEQLNPTKTLPELLGFTSSAYPPTKFRMAINPEEAAGAMHFYLAHKDDPVKERPLSASAKKAKVEAAVPDTAAQGAGAAAEEAEPVVVKKEKKKKAVVAEEAAAPPPAPVSAGNGVEEKKKNKKKAVVVEEEALAPEPVSVANGAAEKKKKKDKKDKASKRQVGSDDE